MKTISIPAGATRDERDVLIARAVAAALRMAAKLHRMQRSAQHEPQGSAEK